MKMIINVCFGGFGIRDEVMERLGLTSQDSEETRTNPNLIALIESGEDVSDEFAELKVVTLPDDCTDYYIDEYDGNESIIYVVNGKLHWA